MTDRADCARAEEWLCERGYADSRPHSGPVIAALLAEYAEREVAEEHRIGAEAAIELVRLRVNQAREAIAKYLESFGCAEWCGSEHDESCYTEIASAARRGDIG